jgi:uncharacterized protein YbbC (DUF1343 family)
MAVVATGLENLLEAAPDWAAGKRLGLLCHPASVDGRLRHGRERIARRFPGALKALYSPQHGFFGEKQDNMVESDHRVDPLLHLPVWSLYGETRKPSPEMLADIDLLLVDLQDAGTRVYTFAYTLSYCMETARDAGVEVAVLDRPNPVDGVSVEGNLLRPEWASFVGRYPIPMRHGLTLGELAGLFNEAFGIGCRLHVVPMKGWKRTMDFAETGLPWVAPSPNLPSPASAAVYPGQVVWEGTNVSEGRGTTQPFELFGAPWLDPARLAARWAADPPPGAVLRETAFEPVFHKWKGELCRGFQIHVTDRRRYRPYETTLRLIQELLRGHPDDFRWRMPPYEYAYRRMPIDLIIGDGAVRRGLEAMVPVREMAAGWEPELEAFRRLSSRFRLYR